MHTDKQNESQINKHLWLDWAKELQFIAQAGLTYSHDPFDIERFERIREISAEIISLQSSYPLQRVKDLFCNESGFQTPKMDCRGVVFQNGKILLVQESSGLWTLPGGWIDVMQTIRTNTEKEVKEEAGLDVKAVRIIALLDRNLHNKPLYAYNICKAFVLCELIGGSFQANIETIGSAYFSLNELPPLAVDKTTIEQIEICFQAYKEGDNWLIPFD